MLELWDVERSETHPRRAHTALAERKWTRHCEGGEAAGSPGPPQMPLICACELAPVPALLRLLNLPMGAAPAVEM